MRGNVHHFAKAFKEASCAGEKKIRTRRRDSTPGYAPAVAVVAHDFRKDRRTLLAYFRRSCSFMRTIYPREDERSIRNRALERTREHWYECQAAIRNGAPR